MLKRKPRFLGQLGLENEGLGNESVDALQRAMAVLKESSEAPVVPAALVDVPENNMLYSLLCHASDEDIAKILPAAEIMTCVKWKKGGGKGIFRGGSRGGGVAQKGLRALRRGRAKRQDWLVERQRLARAVVRNPSSGIATIASNRVIGNVNARSWTRSWLSGEPTAHRHREDRKGLSREVTAIMAKASAVLLVVVRERATARTVWSSITSISPCRVLLEVVLHKDSPKVVGRKAL